MKSKNLLIGLLAVIVYVSGFAQAAEPPPAETDAHQQRQYLRR